MNGTDQHFGGALHLEKKVKGDNILIIYIKTSLLAHTTKPSTNTFFKLTYPCQKQHGLRQALEFQVS